jgi:hypothetical protein
MKSSGQNHISYPNVKELCLLWMGHRFEHFQASEEFAEALRQRRSR